MKESYTNLGNVTVPILYWMPWSVNFDLNFVVGEVCMYMQCDGSKGNTYYYVP